MTITKRTIGATLLVAVGLAAVFIAFRCNTRLALTDPVDHQAQFAKASLTYARQCMLAFHLYAFDHQDQFPTNFDQVASFLPGARTQTNLTSEQFEIVYRGSLSELTNTHNVIVIRQKEAWQSDGETWNRAYGFADGHSEIRSEADGNYARGRRRTAII